MSLEIIAYITLAILAAGGVFSSRISANRIAQEHRAVRYPVRLAFGMRANAVRDPDYADKLLDTVVEWGVRCFTVSHSRMRRMLGEVNVRFISSSEPNKYHVFCQAHPAEGGPNKWFKCGGWYKGRELVVVCNEGDSLSHSAFLHELIHFIAHRMYGDVDAHHRNTLLWALENKVKDTKGLISEHVPNETCEYKFLTEAPYVRH
jgi:hypothetical protein